MQYCWDVTAECVLVAAPTALCHLGRQTNAFLASWSYFTIPRQACPCTPSTPHCCPREPPQPRFLRRSALGPQIGRLRLGVGVQYGGHHPPGRKALHGRQGPQGQTLTQRDGPLQVSRRWPLLRSGHPGRISSWGKAPVFGSSLRCARRGCLRRVPVQRCKPCANPCHCGDMPRYLPAGLTQYVLNNFFKKSPPYHVTQAVVSTPEAWSGSILAATLPEPSHRRAPLPST